MADNFTHYMGGSRVAPRPEIASPELARRSPVGTFSRPAMDSDVEGTGALLSGPKQHRGRGGQTAGSMQEVTSPLDLSGHDEIIAASGLGKKPTWAKRPGDPDEPTQGVETQPDGTMVHHRTDPTTGRVQSTPVGSGKPRLRGAYSDSGGLNFFAGDE